MVGDGRMPTPRLIDKRRTWDVDELDAAYKSLPYGGYVAEAIAQAALPDRCVLHGLRKASARRPAEAGCSSKQKAAGRKTLSEVERYTCAAEQQTLATATILKLTSSN